MELDLNHLITIVTLTVTVLTACSVFVTIIQKLRDKHLKTKNVELTSKNEELVSANDSLKGETDFLKVVNELTKTVIPSAIEVAEHSGLATPQTKLTFALSQIALWCAKNDFNYASNEDLFKDMITQLIKFSKKVNYPVEVKKDVGE